MAEAIFNKLSDGTDDFGFSRGTNVFFPQKTSSKSVEALRKLGIEDFNKKSEMITEDDISASDFVLTMTSSHKMALKSAFPKFKDKIFTLTEKVYGKESDILDPYGLSQEEYDKCAKQR